MGLLREIKFRAWDGERLRDVWSLGWIDGEMDYISTPKHNGPAEEFKLMQYTGLKDKNGREIYESDIVASVKYGKGYEVVYYSQGFWLRWIAEGGKSPLWWESEDIEVIGNIYENPELLQKS